MAIQNKAGAVADDIIRQYETALERINVQIKDTFRNFTAAGGITVEEGKRLLTAADSDKQYQELLQLYQQAGSPELRADILNRIHAQAYGARISRMEGLKQRIYIELAKVANYEAKTQKQLYTDTINTAYYSNIYNIAEGLNCGVDFTVLPKRAIGQALSEPWKGANYSTRIWHNNAEFIKTVQDTVTQGLIGGESVPRMAERLKTFVTDENQDYVTERLVRTETSHFMNTGQRMAYEDIGIKQYRFVAALSERTCDTCGALDGRIFDVRDAIEGKNYPPIHPRCRCLTIMADAKLNTRIARDPVTGANYKVDGSMTFEQWKNSLSGEQREAMSLHVRQMKNSSTDKRQYEKYVSVIGKEHMPKTFDKFQDLKYNESEKWGFVKLDYKRRNTLLNHPEQKLPNAEKVMADDRKFTDYLFNANNAQGWAKGKAIESRLGYDKNSYEELKNEILSGARRYPAVHKGNNGYGDRYEQKMILYGKNNKPANVVVGWMKDKSGTKMTSAYIKEVRKNDD